MTGYLRALVPAATGSALFAAVWLLTAAVVRGAMSDMATVVSASLTGLTAYLVLVRLLVPGDFRHQPEFARLVLRPRAAA